MDVSAKCILLSEKVKQLELNREKLSVSKQELNEQTSSLSFRAKEEESKFEEIQIAIGDLQKAIKEKEGNLETINDLILLKTEDWTKEIEKTENSDWLCRNAESKLQSIEADSFRLEERISAINTKFESKSAELKSAEESVEIKSKALAEAEEKVEDNTRQLKALELKLNAEETQLSVLGNRCRLRKNGGEKELEELTKAAEIAEAKAFELEEKEKALQRKIVAMEEERFEQSETLKVLEKEMDEVISGLFHFI